MVENTKLYPHTTGIDYLLAEVPGGKTKQQTLTLAQ